MIERLEARRLLSVTLEDGVLTVTGTDNDDALFVARHQDRLVVSDNGALSMFNPAHVDSIVIHGLDGNDRIAIGPGVHKPIEVFGGEGNDTIRGGSGPENLYGGPGNDLIAGGGGGDLIDGGEGNDLLHGGPGPDTILGGPGDDRINAWDGFPDLIDGGDGEDWARVDQHDTVMNVEHVFMRPRPAPSGPSSIFELTRIVESEEEVLGGGSNTDVA